MMHKYIAMIWLTVAIDDADLSVFFGETLPHRNKRKQSSLTESRDLDNIQVITK